MPDVKLRFYAGLPKVLNSRRQVGLYQTKLQNEILANLMYNQLLMLTISWLATGTYAKSFARPRSDQAESPRSCDNDESRVFEPAYSPAKTQGNGREIPAITIILTETLGRVSVATSQLGKGVVKFNTIMG
jgi:hypothetical protein